MDQGLSKAERLKSRKQITNLFSKKSHVFSYPFKMVYSKPEPFSKSSVQLLVSVSKRSFKHAVDRNKLKRLIREAYRKNKGELYHELINQNQSIRLGILFVGKEILEYKDIESGMIKALSKLKNAIQSAPLK